VERRKQINGLCTCQDNRRADTFAFGNYNCFSLQHRTLPASKVFYGLNIFAKVFFIKSYEVFFKNLTVFADLVGKTK